MNFGQLWEQLVDCICRPPRDRYTLEDLIGGERHRFVIGSCQGIREDLELVNDKGQKLQCSHFKPANLKDQVLPCVVYCHCNSGSRRDAEEAIILLVPQGISVFCMDFAGSGLSDGEWVTLGAREVDDLETVIDHLRSGGKASTIGLWGRSMGAVTALMYCKRNPTVAGVVLDSPFSRLNDLMLELVQEQQIPIPRPFVKVALAAMRRSVRKRAGFDIYQVAPLESVHEAFVPVLFGHANGDTFVRKSHSEKLHEKYAGDKNLITFEGDHNSRRPQFFYNSASIFFHNVLQVDSEHQGSTTPEPQPNGLMRMSSMCLNSARSRDYEPGETNIPWNPSWTTGRDTPVDFDDLLWAPSSNTRADSGGALEDSASLTGTDSAEGQYGHLQHDDGTWYGMLPDSAIAEESMLQAALAASLAELRDRNLDSGGDKATSVGGEREAVSDEAPEGISGRNNVAHQVDLLHRELGSSLSTDAQSQGHHNTDANGGGVMHGPTSLAQIIGDATPIPVQLRE